MLPTTGLKLTGPNGKIIQLEEHKGGGAFGVVYRAVDTESGTEYAVKFPQSGFVGNQAELAAFFNEARASVEIQHSNVVRVFHVETSIENLPPYLVMEFLNTGTIQNQLDQYKASNKLVDIGLIKYWTNCLIEGITAINSKMLHRDLKPDNILLDGDTPKIGDFGLSKIIGAATRNLTFKGGQHMLYMAPEGWKNETNEIQIDMYAMGIVLFQIASLQFPFNLPPDWNVTAIQEMHLFQQPKVLQDIRPDLPLLYCHIVSRLLQKRPKDRFSSWDEVKELLDKAWSSTNVSAEKSKNVLSALLNETGRMHEAQMKKQAEEDRRRTKIEEERNLDIYHKKQLISIIREAINDFNEQSAFGKIYEVLGKVKFESIIDGSYHTFTLPLGGSINIDFFRVDPPFKLKRGFVRYVGVLKDSDGAGIHFLLCRDSIDDLYGNWCICKVNVNRFVDPRKFSVPIEPVPFTSTINLREIERADSVTHVYTVQYYDDIKETFLSYLLEFFQRRSE